MLPHGDNKKRTAGRMTATPFAWRLATGIVAFGVCWMLYQVRASAVAVEASLSTLTAEVRGVHEQQAFALDRLTQTKAVAQSAVDALAGLKTVLQTIQHDMAAAAPRASLQDEAAEGWKSAMEKMVQQVNQGLEEAQKHLSDQRSSDLLQLQTDVKAALDGNVASMVTKMAEEHSKLRYALSTTISEQLKAATTKQMNETAAAAMWAERRAAYGKTGAVRELSPADAAVGSKPVDDMEGVPSATSSTAQPGLDGETTQSTLPGTGDATIQLSNTAEADKEAAAAAAAEVEVAAAAEAAEAAEAAAVRAEVAGKVS